MRQIEARRFDKEGETSADGSAAAPVSQAEDEGEGGEVLAAAGEISEGEGESNGAGEGEGDFSYGDGTVESITVPCNGGGCKPTLASRGTTRQRVGLRGQQRAAGAARST